MAHGKLLASFVFALVAAATMACDEPSSGLSGTVVIDGSSTVFPITEAVAEEFSIKERKVRVSVGVSGTGGGFQKFCSGETSITNASRPISAGEIDACRSRDIDFIELPIAYDGIAVVVHPRNSWADCITLAELKKLWEPAAQGNLTRWNQIRPDWPDARIMLFGPATDSGTFDYFTEVVVGKSKESRGDFTASEDDNVLIQGVAGDRNSLGYFGFAYYIENENKLKALAIDSGRGCVAPDAATVETGSYAPLSRPLFIYVKKSDAARPEIQAFVDFYIENAGYLATDVGYVKLPDRLYSQVQQRWRNQETGTLYSNPPPGATLEQLLQGP